LNLIKRSQLPKASIARLGDTNGTIVYNLVTDVIKNSFQTAAIAFSQEVSDALKKFREFNLNHIYLNPKIKPDASKLRHLFKVLLERYFKDLKQGNQESIIFTEYLDGMSNDYKYNTQPAEIVRDFIAGMTDEYFLRQCPEETRPRRITRRF
jgi:dGTPase